MLVRGTGGLSPHKALALFVIARYFGYENDRTHVIKVVVLVVKITIQLTYGIHGFTKKKHTTTVVYLMPSIRNSKSESVLVISLILIHWNNLGTFRLLL